MSLAGLATSLLLIMAAQGSHAQETSKDISTEAPASAVSGTSALDAQGFYQLLIAEIERRNGRPAVAFELTLDAARRLKEGELFQRATQIALESRSVDRALNAAKAWRQAMPKSLEPLRMQMQLMAILNRFDDLAEPLQVLLKQAEPDQRIGLIASLPSILANATDARKAATVVETSLKRYVTAAPTRTVALTSIARLWWQAQQGERSLALIQQALSDEPQALGPALLAIEMMKTQPGAQALARQVAVASPASSPVQLAYARTLLQGQNLQEARQHLERLTASPDVPHTSWLLLGLTLVELKDREPAKAALERFLHLDAQNLTQTPSQVPAAASAADEEDDNPHGGTGSSSAANSRDQAHLLLAQLALDARDWAAMARSLDAVEDPTRRWEVLSLRANALWRQGRLDEGLQLLRDAPESQPRDDRAKLRAQVQLLRQAEQLTRAYETLAQLLALDPQDDDLIYEQAMLADRLKRHEDMERLLRQILQRDPKHVQANNALGYSLADRGERLDEARRLIQTALEGAPGDPFITDSLGWVEFRLGRTAEALKLLRQAHGTRPDPEIAAHLGEVLWVSGQREQARSVWDAALKVDSSNEVLRETMQRLAAGR
jgi:tetratricopeptide (TPR) repeat protein